MCNFFCLNFNSISLFENTINLSIKIKFNIPTHVLFFIDTVIYLQITLFINIFHPYLYLLIYLKLNEIFEKYEIFEDIVFKNLISIYLFIRLFALIFIFINIISFKKFNLKININGSIERRIFFSIFTTLLIFFKFKLISF
jgi:hypothetical protein